MGTTGRHVPHRFDLRNTVNYLGFAGWVGKVLRLGQPLLCLCSPQQKLQLLCFILLSPVDSGASEIMASGVGMGINTSLVLSSRNVQDVV